MSKKKNKIIFILGSVSQPRCIKRINSFMEHGFCVEVYGFNRGKYNNNANIKGVEIKILGEHADGTNYAKKFFNNNKAIKEIINNHDPKTTIFYSFGFALTLSLIMNGCKIFIYEISDILYGYNRFNKIRWLLKSIDVYLIKKSKLTVLTSRGFASYLFRRKTPKNVIIQPNKLSSLFHNKERPAKEFLLSKSLVFSYVGAFRYPNTVFRFARIIGEKYPNYQFHFYGDSHLTPEVKLLSNKYHNVSYFGSFKNPEDLCRIYNRLDVIVACYDTNSLNEKIAEPNKLYESLFYNKPIIVSENTYLAERVMYYGCGFAINASSDDSIIAFLNSINLNILNGIKEKVENIDTTEIIDDNSARIIKYLEKNP